jgi:pathogenesis-related protein 1
MRVVMLLWPFLLVPGLLQAEFLDCVQFDGFEDAGTTNAANLAGLKVQNCARKTVTPVASPPLSPLTWNATIATYAQNYANACVYQHNPANLDYGENIYAGAGAPVTLAGASASWASEEPDYDYASNGCSGAECGHYTQIVWRDTHEVGCGVAACGTNSPFLPDFPDWTFVVCDYDPPGNFDGERPY